MKDMSKIELKRYTSDNDGFMELDTRSLEYESVRRDSYVLASDATAAIEKLDRSMRESWASEKRLAAERDAIDADHAALVTAHRELQSQLTAALARAEAAEATLAVLAKFTVENSDLKIKVSKLQAIIDRAHFELSLEDVNPDDNRAAVLAILKPTQSSPAATSETGDR